MGNNSAAIMEARDNRPGTPIRRRRTTSTISKSCYVDVDVDLDDFSDDDLIAELEERKISVAGALQSSRATVERLYYATRDGNTLTTSQVAEVHRLLADLYGRAT